MICDDYDGVWSKIFKKSKNRKAEKVPATAGPCQPPTLGNFGPSAGFTFCSRSPPSVENIGLRILSKSEGGVTQIQKCETCHVTQGRCGTLGGQTGSPGGQRGKGGEGQGAKMRIPFRNPSNSMVGNPWWKTHVICDDYDGVWSKIFKKSKNRNAEKVPPTGCPSQPPTLGNFRRLLRVRFSLVLLLQAARTSTSKRIKSEGGVPDFRYRLLTAGDSISPRL